MKRWNYNGQDINWNDPESIARYCPEDEYEYLPEDEEVIDLSDEEIQLTFSLCSPLTPRIDLNLPLLFRGQTEGLTPSRST